MSGRRRGDDEGSEGRRPVKPAEATERGGGPGAVKMRRDAACGRHPLHVPEATFAHDSAALVRTVPVPLPADDRPASGASGVCAGPYPSAAPKLHRYGFGR